MAQVLFYEAYNPLVEVFVAACSLDKTEAEDCRQDAWMTILEWLPQFKSDGTQARLCSWIHSIVRTKAADLGRYRTRHPAEGLRMEAEEKVDCRHAPLVPVNEQIEAEETVQKLLELLRKKIPDSNFSAFHKRWIQQQTVPEIAADLKMSTHEVSWRIYEAMRESRLLDARMYRSGGTK